MALTADRNTPSRDLSLRQFGVAATKKIFAGSLVVLNSTGYAQPGTAAAGLICAGRAEEQVDNSAGADGALTVDVRVGCYRFANSAAADAIAATDIGQPCFIVDDQTVAKTDNAGARSQAGTIVDVDDQGVWVEIEAADALSRVASLNFGSINAAASADLTIAVTGARVNDAVALGLPAAPTAGIVFQAFVDSADSVTVRATNISAAPVDPAAANYRVTIDRD